MNSGTNSSPAGVYTGRKSNIGDKISQDTSGLSDILLISRVEKIKAFPPPSPPCNVVPQFELPIKTTNAPTLNEGEGEGCEFFCSLWLPYLRTMSQQFCR